MTSERTVLVVDDEPLIRMDLVSTLEHKGCKTLEAGSAAEAIALLERHPEVTVVFTDIQMPGTMDGIALAQYVRKRWPPTIIVVSSGMAIATLGILSDDMPFLAKPYDDAKLTSVIEGVMTGKV